MQCVLLFARFSSAQETRTHGVTSNCRKWVNDGIDQQNYTSFHKSIYIRRKIVQIVIFSTLLKPLISVVVEKSETKPFLHVFD